jgi:hypothetical protein
MTPWQLALLCHLSHYDFPADWGAVGKTAAALARMILESGDELTPSGEQALKALEADPLAGPMVLIAREVQSLPPGFAGCAFASADSQKVLAMRGSDPIGSLAGLIDWPDNILAPLRGSDQYPSVERFVNRYPQGPLTLTGHSKGAHNAMYALAVAHNQAAVCVCFDGQGFARCQLTDAQRDRLRASAINYVGQNDPVGALLSHPEKRVFVQQDGPAHALFSIVFDENGYPIPARRPLWSYALQALTTCLAARWGWDCAPDAAQAT